MRISDWSSDVCSSDLTGGGSTTPPVWFDNLEITEPRTYVRFTDDSVNYVEWPQGVFILSSPQRESDDADVITRQVDGYDLAQLLQDDMIADRLDRKSTRLNSSH